MPAHKHPNRRDDGLLPRNISWHLRSKSSRRNGRNHGGGGRRRCSWIRRIVTAYVRSAAILLVMSLLTTLALAAAVWWFMPAWLFAPVEWMPEWREVIDTDALVNWSQEATDRLRKFAHPVPQADSPPVQPVSVATPVFDSLPTTTLLNTTTPTE